MKQYHVLAKMSVVGADVKVESMWTGKRWIDVPKASARPRMYSSQSTKAFQAAKEAANGSHVWWLTVGLDNTTHKNNRN